MTHSPSPAFRFGMVGLAALFLATCASPATYAPATRQGGTGYSETQIETNRYRVTYRGGDQVTARDFALRRAADLTLARGFDWFRITNASNTQESNGRSGPNVSVGGGVSTGGRHTSSGIGIGIGLPVGSSRQAAVHSIEILMGAGAKPSDPNIYDAHSITQSLH